MHKRFWRITTGITLVCYCYEYQVMHNMIRVLAPSSNNMCFYFSVCKTDQQIRVLRILLAISTVSRIVLHLYNYHWSQHNIWYYCRYVLGAQGSEGEFWSNSYFYSYVLIFNINKWLLSITQFENIYLIPIQVLITSFNLFKTHIGYQFHLF
jgi:hypothetical protein